MHAQAVTDLKVAEQESTKASTDVNDLRHSLAELQEVGDVDGVAGARVFCWTQYAVTGEHDMSRHSERRSRRLQQKLIAMSKNSARSEPDRE